MKCKNAYSCFNGVIDPLFIALYSFTDASITLAVEALPESSNTFGTEEPLSEPSEPPVSLIIRNELELAELWAVTARNDNELEDYLKQTGHYYNGIQNREVVTTFFNLIESLPLPVIPNAEFWGTTYYPELQSLDIAYRMKTGESFGFIYGLTRNTEEYMEELTGQKPIPIYQKEDGRIKVYNSTRELDPYADFTRYLMDIDGFYVNVLYRNEDIKDFSVVTPDQVFGEAVLSTLQVITNYKSHDISVLLNGLYLNFDQPPVMESDRVLVPFRAIYEALGAKVEWDNDSQTVTATTENNTIVTRIDNKQITINGKPITLDVPARLIGGRALVPVRAVSEGLGAKVDWDNKKRQVIINTN